MANEEFVDTNWTTADKITQTKKRQEKNNFLHLLAKVDSEPVPYEDYSSEIEGLNNNPGTPDITVQVFVDGGLVDDLVVTTGNGAVKFSNINVSAVGDGIRTLRIVSAIGGKTVRWVKGKDMERLTVWGDLFQSAVSYQGEDQTYYRHTRTMSNISVINHRVDQTW